jgi:hypothetical protein
MKTLVEKLKELNKLRADVIELFLHNAKKGINPALVKIHKLESEIAFARGMDSMEVNGKCYMDIYDDLYFNYVVTEIVPQIKALRDNKIKHK